MTAATAELGLEVSEDEGEEEDEDEVENLLTIKQRTIKQTVQQLRPL